MRIPLSEYELSGDSPVHRLDTRVKLVVTVVLIVGILAVPDRAWPAYPLLWALVGSLAALSQSGVWRVARLGGLALPFALASLTLLFTTPGQPLVNIGGLQISDAGLARFVLVVLKSWLSVQVALVLSMTTDFADLLWALESLRVPRRLVTIIGFMYRYLFTLQDEAERLLRARAARSGAAKSGRSGGSILWRARIAGSMVGCLFLRSYERSERVYAAMLARGYKGELKRISPMPLTWSSVLRGAVPVVGLLLIHLVALGYGSR